MTTMPTTPPPTGAHLRTPAELVDLAYIHQGTPIVFGHDWHTIKVAGQVYCAPAGGAR